jgi:hypothetical protein
MHSTELRERLLSAERAMRDWDGQRGVWNQRRSVRDLRRRQRVRRQ